MSPTLILGAIVVVPVVIIMVLRINAALVFLSLCLGDVLVQFVSGDTDSFMSLFSSSHAVSHVATNHNYVKVGLLLLPVLLTMLFMIKTVRGIKLALNLLPAAGVGLLGALLAVPLLSAGLKGSVTHTQLWTQAQRAEDLIVGVSALLCLLMLWLQRPKSSHNEKHGKHH